MTDAQKHAAYRLESAEKSLKDALVELRIAITLYRQAMEVKP